MQSTQKMSLQGLFKSRREDKKIVRRRRTQHTPISQDSHTAHSAARVEWMAARRSPV